jgi:hypothetical protein
VQEQTPTGYGDVPFGTLVSRRYKDWSGRVRLIKHSHGHLSSPFDKRACVLFDGVLSDIASDYFWVDNGGTLADYTSVDGPVTNLDNWTHQGTGLASGIRYYYSLFLFDTDGNFIYDPTCLSSAYAYSRYGHARWIKNQIPGVNWDQDKSTRDLAGMISSIGKHFDSLKTDADRLAYLWNPELLDYDMLGLLEEMFAWPQDPNINSTFRRRELYKIHEFLTRKGRLDNFLDAVSYSYRYKPYVHKEWRSILFANSAHSPRCRPLRVDTVEKDFTGDEGWLTSGDTKYWGELGVQTVHRIWLPLGFDWPKDDDYFTGNQILIETDPRVIAIITEYNAQKKYLVLDRLITFDDDEDYVITPATIPFFQILLGTPRLKGAYRNTLLDKHVNDRGGALQTVPRTDSSQTLSGLFIRVEPESDEDNRNIGHIVHKIQLLDSILLSATTLTSLYIRPKPFIEAFPTPVDYATILTGPFTE